MANVLTPAGGIFRPPRGGRRRKDVGSCLVSIFLSTPSARRATFKLPAALKRAIWAAYLAEWQKKKAANRTTG